MSAGLQSFGLAQKSRVGIGCLWETLDDFSSDNLPKIQPALLLSELVGREEKTLPILTGERPSTTSSTLALAAIAGQPSLWSAGPQISGLSAHSRTATLAATLPPQKRPKLPLEVRAYALRHGLLGSIAVANDVIARLLPAATVEISLETDTEAAITEIFFTLRLANQTLDEVIEWDSKLHDEIFNAIPGTALRFMSFRLDLK